jgi:proliferating cell nuclear antigen PCNA
MSISNNKLNTNVNYIFKAKTKEAFVFKVLGELLSNTLKFAPFKINETGIYLRQADHKRQQLLDIYFPKEKFTVFKCSAPINFIVSSNNFYKMLKNIKKKDSVLIYIREDEPDRLGICVEQGDDNNKVSTTIKITYNQLEEINLPDDYKSPIIMNNKEFQKMKNLHNISKSIIVNSLPGYIRFFCDDGDLYSREITIGEIDEDEKQDEPYEQSFLTQHLTQLTKCAGQSGNVQVFTMDGLPLKIKMNLGNIGELVCYIKSKEMIEEEEIDNSTQNE